MSNFIKIMSIYFTLSQSAIAQETQAKLKIEGKVQETCNVQTLTCNSDEVNIWKTSEGMIVVEAN